MVNDTRKPISLTTIVSRMNKVLDTYNEQKQQSEQQVPEQVVEEEEAAALNSSIYNIANSSISSIESEDETDCEGYSTNTGLNPRNAQHLNILTFAADLPESTTVLTTAAKTKAQPKGRPSMHLRSNNQKPDCKPVVSVADPVPVRKLRRPPPRTRTNNQTIKRKTVVSVDDLLPLPKLRKTKQSLYDNSSDTEDSDVPPTPPSKSKPVFKVLKVRDRLAAIL